MCLAPINIKRQDPSGLLTVDQCPCGHCLECLKDYQNSWKIRLSEEFAETMQGVFVTLTYDPASAPLAFDPESGELIESDEYMYLIESSDNRVLSLCHKHVQSWIKRCRERFFRAVGKRSNFKYFVCGEYGPRTLRPHYHCFFTGIEYEDFVQYFQADWQNRFGFVSSSKILLREGKSPQRVANYVSKYCSKGEFESPRVSLGYVEKPRRTMSKGIGAAYASRLKSEILKGYHDSSVSHPEEFDKQRLREELVFNQEDNLHNLYYSYLTFYRSKEPDNEPVKAVDLPIKSDFLKRVNDSLFCQYYDAELNQVFIYKMPRYLKKKIIGQKTSLAVQLRSYVQEEHERVHSQKLAELLSANPTWSADEANHHLVLQDYYERFQRLDNARASLRKSYSQSKF